MKMFSKFFTSRKKRKITIEKVNSHSMRNIVGGLDVITDTTSTEYCKEGGGRHTPIHNVTGDESITI